MYSWSRPRFLRQSVAGRFFVSCFLFVLLLCQPASGAGTLLVIDYPDYWPFFTRQENGELTGFFYEIVDEALGRLGMTARWRNFPWGRCQDNVKNGEADAMVTVPTPDRLEYAATHPDPFYLKQLTVFTYKDHPRLDFIRHMQTLDDIKAGDLTVVTYFSNSWNDRNIRDRGIKVYETPLLKSVWRMLADRRGDIAIEWPVPAWADIHATDVGHDEIVQTEVTFDPMPFHLLISKKSPMKKILPEFNQVILEMNKSGRIQEIVEKYTHPER